MNTKLMCASIVAFFPVLAFGQTATSYQCTFEQLQRRIEIVSEPGVTVPCEVHYYKDSEMPGDKQVLWSAGSEAGYCDARASEFVAKLREWGWQCKAGDAAATVAEPEASTESAPEPTSDDTEALAPATE